MILVFTVQNGENPVPYKRTTQRGKWNKKYKKYLEWKGLIFDTFTEKFKTLPENIIKKGIKYHVSTMIYFKDKRHGDPDNVQKGIKDSIFRSPLSDKYCSGDYDFDYDPINPRVIIRISEV